MYTLWSLVFSPLYEATNVYVPISLAMRFNYIHKPIVIMCKTRNSVSIIALEDLFMNLVWFL
jgi:hypothetical protein